MKYLNGNETIRAMQWNGQSSKHELMKFTGETFLAMMGSESNMKVFVDDIDGESFIVNESDYVLGNKKDGFTKLSKKEFNEKYPDFNTIIVEV